MNKYYVLAISREDEIIAVVHEFQTDNIRKYFLDNYKEYEKLEMTQNFECVDDFVNGKQVWAYLLINENEKLVTIGEYINDCITQDEVNDYEHIFGYDVYVSTEKVIDTLKSEMTTPIYKLGELNYEMKEI